MYKFEWIAGLFQAIDARDVEAFCGYLSEDAVFRFGNAPAVQGREAIREAVGGFFGAIAGLRHTVAESWMTEEAVICHGSVTYTRHDGSELTVPFADIFKMEGELIHDYLIYIDASALFAQG